MSAYRSSVCPRLLSLCAYSFRRRGPVPDFGRIVVSVMPFMELMAIGYLGLLGVIVYTPSPSSRSYVWANPGRMLACAFVLAPWLDAVLATVCASGLATRVGTPVLFGV